MEKKGTRTMRCKCGTIVENVDPKATGITCWMCVYEMTNTNPVPAKKKSTGREEPRSLMD